MKYDLGIVLSHEVDKEGKLSRQSKVRVEEGVRLFQEGMFRKLIMSGGHLDGNSFSISSKMKEYALEIDSSLDILTEEISLDTVGQLVFLKEGIIEPLEAKSFVLITHYWHSAKTEFMVYSLFDDSYNIKFVSLEQEKYHEERKKDFKKLAMFMTTFPKWEIKSASSLVQLLTENHFFYNGNYGSLHKGFSIQYFKRELDKLKKENEN